MADWYVFWIIAPISVVSAGAMVLARNAVHAALLLIVNFFTLAVFFLILGSPFLFVVQIIVYAGAIMVLFLFVVMLLNVPREDPAPPAVSALLGPTGMRLGIVLSLLLGVEVAWAMSRIGPAWLAQGSSATSVASVALIGEALFTRHAFAFEATSILILVAMVGAVVLARKEQH